MDNVVGVRAKRNRDISSSDSEVESAQLKFTRLLVDVKNISRFLETNYASQDTNCDVSLDELKKTTLQFIDDHQSFAGILQESEASMVQQGCSSLESLSFLTVEVCVAQLKSQASKTSCPLDLLAAERLGTRLITVSTDTSEHGQLLKENQLVAVNCILKIIKHLLSEQGFNRVSFTKHLTNKGHRLPLEVVWMLDTNCIVSFSTYLACCLQHKETVKIFADGLAVLCSNIIVNKQKQDNILSVILGSLLRVSFLENKTKEGSNNRLEKVSQEILDAVVDRSDFSARKQNNDFSDKEGDENSFCVLEIIRRLNDTPQTVLRKFFTRQLNRLFMAPSEVVTSALSMVYHAVSTQRKWTFSSLTQTTRTVFEQYTKTWLRAKETEMSTAWWSLIYRRQFLLIFDPPTVTESLKQAFFKDKVNWENSLSFLSVFVVLVKEAASLIDGYVNNLLNESLQSNDTYSLSVAFLLIRQMSLEGGHVFQPYMTWFQSAFGDQGNLKLGNKRSVQFFTRFLSDLVPYEPAEYLKVHILRAPQVPAKLRVFVTDYASLARTRLMDLKEPVETMGIFGDSSAVGTDPKNENAKQLEHASAEVGKVLETFEETGKVPSTVMEASIFRKPYFVGRFLPALLLPRKIPDEPDAKAQLIEVLNKAGKIPKKMLLSYQSACETISNEQIEVSSSSDEEGPLSSMERLNKSLDQATKLILESLKTADKAKQAGRVSSQLSIIFTNIQSAIKTSDVSGLTNQLVELDVNNLAKDEIEPASNAVLSAFCRTRAAVNSCTIESCEQTKRHQWARSFVAVVSSIPAVHKSVYQQLWSQICCEGVSLMADQVSGLAAFLCHLCVHNNTMTPLLLKGTRLHAALSLRNDLTICSYLDALCDSVPIHTSRWMELFLRFSCSYLEHAITAFDGNITEVTTKAGDHTAYFPQVLLKKMLYLLHRLNVNEESNFFRPTLSQDLVGLVSSVVSLPMFKRLKEKHEQLTLPEWCTWELSISARDDFLPETERRVYHQFRVLDHFLPLGSLEGGCDGSAREACSVILHALLDSGSGLRRDPSRPGEFDGPSGTDVSRNDMISLLQELLPMLSRADNVRDVGGKPHDSWLLDQLDSRIRKIHSQVDENKNKVCDLQRASEVATFMKLAIRLPPFLLFADRQDSTPDTSAIRRVTAFINSVIRLYLSENCCLPFDMTAYLLKAVITYLNGSLHQSRKDAESSQLLTQFMKDCPLFFVSLQHYWKQLRPLALTHSDVTHEPLKQAESLFNWKNRVEAAQSASIQELECLDPCVLSSCIAVTIQNKHSKILTLFDTRTSPTTEFLSKFEDFLKDMTKYSVSAQALTFPTLHSVAVCLFDCIMAKFSEMILHGHEVADSADLRDFALKVVKRFPKTLSVFSDEKNSDFQDILHRLRSFVVKEQLISLYPAVFFSFFSSSPREAIQEVTRIQDFLKITLCMYNSFVSLRKDCLEGVGSKSAISSPLHLDFCRRVSNFVRNCVLSSPEEHLRGLSQDVISSCTSELRQFLHSQLAKYPQR